MTEHKHAWFLRALTDGEPLENFEVKHINYAGFHCVAGYLSNLVTDSCKWEVRRKPRMININGIEVPEPMREAPEIGTQYWIATVIDTEPGIYAWREDVIDRLWLSLGVCHLTKEAAEMHRKALLSFTEVKK